MSLSLYDIGAEWQELEQLLMESGGELSDELEERLGELMTTETSKINGYLAVRANLKMVAEGAKMEAERLSKKGKAALNAVDRMESRLLGYMVMRGIPEVVADLGKVRLAEASTEPLEVLEEVDPEFIDEEYRKVVYSIDKALLKKHLKDGTDDERQKAGFFARLGEKSKYLRIT